MSIPHIYDFSEEQVLNLNIDECIILDVRTNEEFNEAHIKSSQHIPLDELSARVNEIANNKIILVYCRSGQRSQKATDFLKQKGFTAHNIGSFFNFTDNLITKISR